MPTGWEWLIILAIALLLFGGTKLAGLGKASGRAIREFKEETKGLDEKEAKAKELAAKASSTQQSELDVIEAQAAEAEAKAAQARAAAQRARVAAQGEHIVDAEIIDPGTK